MENQLYLLDATFIITATYIHHPIRRCPEYWRWIAIQLQLENLAIPTKIIDEITPYDVEVKAWMKGNCHSLALEKLVDRNTLSHVFSHGYEVEMNEMNLQETGNDPFLIAYELRDTKHRVVVTCETSKPSMVGVTRKIPDVCKYLEIDCIPPYKLLDIVEFSSKRYRSHAVGTLYVAD